MHNTMHLEETLYMIHGTDVHGQAASMLHVSISNL